MSFPPVLVADIGGTNARFALVGRQGEILDQATMPTASFAGPAEAARAFLDMAGKEMAPRRAAFAVACPVRGDRVTFTNSPWDFSASAVRDELALDDLRVVNDFTAAALCVPHLASRDRYAIGGGEAVAWAPVAVLGPGTGLGVSALIWPQPGGAPTALATEGGHVTMAAADDAEAAVLAVLRRNGHVSAERVLSGAGLVNLYRALAELGGGCAEPLAPDQITSRAVAGECPFCASALDMFFAMLGTVAANLALSVGATGGVYLAGGILPRFAEAFRASRFRGRFEDKGRFSAYLAEIPVWLITHPQPAFLGLAGLFREPGMSPGPLR